MLAAGLSVTGKVRPQNQDTIFVSTEPVGPLPNLFVVADGMGGHNAGDVASSLAVSLFVEYIREQSAEPADFLDLCVAAAAHANSRVLMLGNADTSLYGMGTTLTACYILNDQIKIVHVGDSRIYVVTADEIIQLTNDHSYVQEMVRAGYLTPRQAREHPKRNVLLRVLGGEDALETDAFTRSLKGACVVLLCSDGLHGMIRDEAIKDIIHRRVSVEERVESLINAANEAGGHDNISVILIEYATNINESNTD